MKLALLRHRYARFLRVRHFGRHFRRIALFEGLGDARISRAVPSGLAQSLLAAARLKPEDILLQKASHFEGLGPVEAAERLLLAGPNEVEHEPPLPWWRRLWHCYSNPFNLLLTALAVVSYLTEDAKATLVISTMVVLSTLLRFWQEGKSNRAADALKAMVSNTATVLRAGEHSELPIRELVPGDLVTLSAGDMIPADCRVLSAKDLFVSQAAMTGESMPVEKFAHLRDAVTDNPLELDNLVFMGTNVVSGAATALVLETGHRTYFGALSARLTATEPAPTAFQAGVNHVSWLLIRFTAVMAPLVLLINGFTKGDWLEALLFALSVAVGLTPEMLPMIVTSTLAKGAVFLSRKKVIVKRLDAIQNLGAMDVLCTDKTGTLTQDKIFLARHTDLWGQESDEVLEYAYLNSYYQTGLKNLLDVAVLEHTEVHRALDPARNFRKVDEIPFDFTRRRMSVVVAERDEHHRLICKGAVEEMLAVCSAVRHGGAVEPLHAATLDRVRAVIADLNQEGLRVVAVAARELPPTQEAYGVADEADLVLIGYVAFLDPPKDSTAPALEALSEHGVTVKVLTGDNELVTRKICQEVGLAADPILQGSEIEAMDAAALARAVESTRVFARLTPAHKERIVRALRANGHVVGFMGDGINDAPALRAADIGISVDSGVDIAKEAADIILLEKSLMVLAEGVIEGRRTLTNMLKYIRMTASSNFGNVFSVLVASAFLPFLPMLPMQLLVQNLLYDISQIAIPFDHVDKEMVARPLAWNPADIGRFMLYFGPLSSIFDLLTFALMWWVFDARTPAHQAVFQSGWFVVGLLTQTLIVHMIRTPALPFVQSRPAPALLVTTLAIMAVGVYLPMGAAAHYFKFEALPWTFFLFVPLVLAGYIVVTQAMKRFYLARHTWQ